MKFVHTDFNNQINFEEGSINYLIVENPILMCELYQCLNGDDKKLILSDNEKPLNISKSVKFIRDPISLEFNEKSILTALNSIARVKLHESDYMRKNMELWSLIDKYFIELFEEIDVPITFEQSENMDGLLKLINIKINEEYENLLEKLVDYLGIMFELCNIKVAVICNIRAYLKYEDIKRLYDMVLLKKWNIMCLDYLVPNDKIEEEKYYVIDQDLCEIF